MTNITTPSVISNPLTDLMAVASDNLLNIYFTAGYPKLNSTGAVLSALQDAGVDMIEIGMPFSDPLADGPTIQQSNMTALANGMNIELMFRQLEHVEFRVPIILMGYLNPVLQFGLERFCERASSTGVSGLILPDLPADLYELKYKDTFQKFNLCNICLVTPQTSDERIAHIDRNSSGFIYAVSSSSTTGNKSNSSSADYLRNLSQLELKNPIMTGFNIRDRKSFQEATRYSRGGIIGSAFIKAITDVDDLDSSIHSFVKSIRP